MSQHSAIINSPIGKFSIIAFDKKLLAIEFIVNSKQETPIKDTLSKKTKIQLDSYFKDPNYTFDLPIHLYGTEFQKKVWRALQEIPAGKTLSYGDLAKKLKTSARAVGNACRANPLPIVIPCHRVVSKNGLGGFAGKQSGQMINVKKFLLAHERDRHD